MRQTLLVFILLGYTVIANAQFRSDKIKPQWLTKGAPEETISNIFIIAFGEGNSLDAARQKCFINLTTQLEHERGITVHSRFKGESHMSRDGYQLQKDFQMECEENDKNISIVCSAKDEYWEKIKNDYNCSILYSVANQNSIGYDNIEITASYANDPATWGLCLIPGAAQMHKGSYLKGGLIMGGSIALAAGATLCSLTRQDYLAKMANTHSAATKQQYVTKSNNLNTGMWTCVGCLAALYVYNIIDAFVAPGARRIIVTPAVSPEGQYGASVTYNF